MDQPLKQSFAIKHSHFLVWNPWVSSQVSQCPSGGGDQAELAEGLSAEFDCCTKNYSKARNSAVPRRVCLTCSEDLLGNCRTRWIWFDQVLEWSMCRFRERFLLLDGLATAQARLVSTSCDLKPSFWCHFPCSFWEAVSVAIAHPLGVDPSLRKLLLWNVDILILGWGYKNDIRVLRSFLQIHVPIWSILQITIMASRADHCFVAHRLTHQMTWNPGSERHVAGWNQWRWAGCIQRKHIAFATLCQDVLWIFLNLGRLRTGEFSTIWNDQKRGILLFFECNHCMNKHT